MCLNSCFTYKEIHVFAKWNFCQNNWLLWCLQNCIHFHYKPSKKILYVHEQLIFFKRNCSDKSSKRKGIVYLMKNKVPKFFLSKYSRNLTLLTSNLIGPESRLSLRLKAFLGRILKGNSTGFFFNMLGLTNEWKIKKIEIVIKILWSWKKILFK